MRIALSGATGFIGTHLAGALADRGHQVMPLTRDDFKPAARTLAGKLDGCGAVINLAGAPIAARWTETYKKVLRASRIDTTRMLVAALELLRDKPPVLVSASGVGIYPAQGCHTEDDRTYADDFLGCLARDWEQEALRAASLGIRTVVFRFGVVLGRDGGALQRMLPLFRLGLGGIIGSGRQAFSWVHITDLLRALIAALEDTGLQGTYNLTAPEPTTNEGLTRAIARALRRPALLRVPGFALRLRFGQGASVLLEGQHALPKRLLDSGFQFVFCTIDQALADLLA